MLPDVDMPCIPVFTDNEGAVGYCAELYFQLNSKHIEVLHHFLRKLVGRKEMSIIRVPSAFQQAVISAKAIALKSFEFATLR